MQQKPGALGCLSKGAVCVKVRDSTVPCPRCGDPMMCVSTGPDVGPDTRATYVCQHAEWKCRAKGNDRETVSVWVGNGRWVSIPVGTPENPLTDEELRLARFALDSEAMDRSVSEGHEDATAFGDATSESAPGIAPHQRGTSS
jgi:hypothetical protein